MVGSLDPVIRFAAPIPGCDGPDRDALDGVAQSPGVHAKFLQSEEEEKMQSG